MDPPDPPPADHAARGRPDVARRDVADALALAPADVHVLFRAFQFHFRAGELEPAERYARLRLAAAGPDALTPHAARAHTNLGLVLLYQKRFDEARDAITRALEIDRAIGFDYGVSRDLGNLSLIPEDLGDFPAAEALLRESLAIAERIGAEDLAATKLANLGDVALAQGRREEARAFWTRAVAIFARLGPGKHHDEFTKKIAALDA
jgi:tetratricopeptide (TPR) repeat protein